MRRLAFLTVAAIAVHVCRREARYQKAAQRLMALRDMYETQPWVPS